MAGAFVSKLAKGLGIIGKIAGFVPGVGTAVGAGLGAAGSGLSALQGAVGEKEEAEQVRQATVQPPQDVPGGEGAAALAPESMAQGNAASPTFTEQPLFQPQLQLGAAPDLEEQKRQQMLQFITSERKGSF